MQLHGNARRTWYLGNAPFRARRAPGRGVGDAPPMDFPAPAPTPAAETFSWPRVPRTLPAGRGLAWWREGWRIFTAAPAIWVGIVVVLFLVFAVISAVPIVGGVAQSVLWPVFSAGLVRGCHELARGRPLVFAALFDGFRGDRFGPLAILGLAALACGVVLALIAMMSMLGAAGASGVAALVATDPQVAFATAMTSAGFAALAIVPLLLIVATVFAMAWWFAPALVVLNRAEPVAALRASFDASWRNLGALTVFGLAFLGLAVVASAPFGLGWLVLAPVATGAGYASWREIFGD